MLGGTFPALIWHDFMTSALQIDKERAEHAAASAHAARSGASSTGDELGHGGSDGRAGHAASSTGAGARRRQRRGREAGSKHPAPATARRRRRERGAPNTPGAAPRTRRAPGAHATPAPPPRRPAAPAPSAGGAVLARRRPAAVSPGRLARGRSARRGRGRETCAVAGRAEAPGQLDRAA